MNTDDLEALKNFFGRQGVLTGCNEDLLEDAIFCLNHGSEYKAECDLRALSANLTNDGHADLAEHVDRLL